MTKSKSFLKFLNRTEKAVKKLDATDILIVALAGFAFGSVIASLSKKFMKKLAPILAFAGAISSAFIIIKLFFNEEEVPYIRIRR